MANRPMVALVLSCLATTGVLAETAAYSRNTFSRHPEWVKTKQFAAKDLIGEEESKLFSTRNILAGNRLNLHEWFGFNEFLIDKKAALGSARWEFSLGPDAYLYFLFNVDKSGRSGIRLSRDRRLPAIHFRADAKGRFLESRAIPGLSLSAGRHRAEVRFGPASFGLRLDGVLVYEAPERAREGAFLGFRAGPREREAFVDDVLVHDAVGRRILSENFRNDRHYAALAGVSAAAAVGTGGLALFLAGGTAAIATQLWLSAFCAGYFAYDYLRWSRQYHYEETPPFVFRDSLALTRLERWRTRFWSALDFADPPPARGAYRAPPPSLADVVEHEPVLPEGGPRDLEVIDGRPPRRRAVGEAKAKAFLEAAAGSAAVKIVYLGTSQLWGAGAARLDDAFVAQAHRRIREGLGGRELLSINASLCGSDSTELLSRYRGLIAAEPALLVVDLSSNDPDPQRFGANIESLIALNKERGIKTLLVLEARYDEGGPDLMAKNHAAMRKAAARHGVPVVDLHGLLSKAVLEDRGFLWWDTVHLTSYGQELAGRSVAEGALKALAAKR